MAEMGVSANEAAPAAGLSEETSQSPQSIISLRPGVALKSALPPFKANTNRMQNAGFDGPLPPARSAETIYGALDLGTNNCRLLVARPSRRGFLVIDAFSRIIKLGEGIGRSGVLSEDAIERTIEALKVCSAKMTRRGVTRSRLVTTEACRIASNGAEFVARVKRETGLTLEVIGRETEARLAVSGCASLIDKQSGYALIFDIGGGSSEFVWLNLAKGRRPKRISIEDRLRMQDCIEAWTSLPFGVVTLTERFGSDCAEGVHFEDMVRFVAKQLAEFSKTHGIGERIAQSGTHLLGTSGTVTTIAGVYLGLSEYHRAKVDGCWLPAQGIRAVSSRIMGMTYDQRAVEPCIGPERADLILAGCAIMEAMLRVWPMQSLRVADRGLREGILATLIAEDAARQRQTRQSKSRYNPLIETSLNYDTPAAEPGAIS
jgi:exopolyphosphatase/guanosine-5'-triphosphate,3'-diphosphate pyrophosphatase